MIASWLTNYKQKISLTFIAIWMASASICGLAIGHLQRDHIPVTCVV